jgi:hypothetical protein
MRNDWSFSKKSGGGEEREEVEGDGGRRLALSWLAFRPAFCPCCCRDEEEGLRRAVVLPPSPVDSNRCGRAGEVGPGLKAALEEEEEEEEVEEGARGERNWALS